MLFICLFIPAIIAVIIYSKIQNEKLNLIYFLVNYPLFLLFINYIILIVLAFIKKSAYLVIDDQSFSSLFAFKYISISLALAIILPFIFITVRKNIKIKITFNRSEKDEK